jgi:hypothetical protein
MLIDTTMAAKKRHTRRPTFPMAGTMSPYGFHPLMAHPVLPGETLQSATAKMKFISKPVAHPLVGAWLETWLCYVKFTDIDRNLGEMFIKDDVSTSGYVASTGDPRYFVQSGQIDWIRMCVDKIHNAYFLDEGETRRDIDGVPMCKINNRSWYQNMIFKPADDAVPVTDGSDTYAHLSGWAMLQQMQMTELTYEQYLETYGVKPNQANDGDPEILRFHRSWTQPTNHVEPSTGAPSSAFVWSEEIKMDKPKRFTEPGFVVLMGCIRPKLFQDNLAASMVGSLWGFSDWFPSYNLEDPTAGVKTLAKDDPVFYGTATDEGDEELLYDHRDLLSHGEQFINTVSHPYRLPVATALNVKTGANANDIRGEYPTTTDIENLFVSPTTDDTARVYYEGLGLLTVSGHVTDTTR